jgi:molecular chaperone GrpE
MSVQSDNFFRSRPAQGDDDEPEEQPVDGDLPPSSDDLETLRAELAELEQKADDYLRLAQRTQADFINYRRRTEDERAQQARDANVAYLQRLLPVLDDFERALSNAAPEDLESSWGQGILLVDRNLRGLLSADDVQRISAEGAEFDPREHEALGSQPSPQVPEGHVLHVVRQGYRKGERILRPAQVIVASKPEAATEPG